MTIVTIGIFAMEWIDGLDGENADMRKVGRENIEMKYTGGGWTLVTWQVEEIWPCLF